MTIPDEQVVTIDYTLKNARDQVLESSQESGPLTFRLDDRRLLPGLAEVLHDMDVGETKRGTIPPGRLVPVERTPKRRIPRGEFPEEAAPKPGDRFVARDPDGRPMALQVFDVEGSDVLVHVLHPLHDEPVRYEVTVVSAESPAPG